MVGTYTTRSVVYIPAEQKKSVIYCYEKDVCVTRRIRSYYCMGDGIKLYLPDSEIIEFKKRSIVN